MKYFAAYPNIKARAYHQKLMLTIFALLLLVVLLSSCASTEEVRISKANPAAYAGDGFMVQKLAPAPVEPSGADFFFQHCESHMETSYFSKTAYECNGL